ncbi:hypothetical protein LBMAG21_13590 [Armatimonadota bacterium]|nr:hypothetical protein LBMAG21_13590 [Armatimonadota bacterium]
MRLWTIQDYTVWEALCSKGELLVDIELSEDYPNWSYAYDWLRKQMAQRMKEHNGNYPWWAWVSPKPDLRRFRHSYPLGVRSVRLELEIEAECVLSSYFSVWEMVLGFGYIATDKEDSDRWDTQGIAGISGILHQPLQSLLEARWERIFDRDALIKGEIWSTDWVQGCFERLRLSDVVRMDEFTMTGQARL